MPQGLCGVNSVRERMTSNEQQVFLVARFVVVVVHVPCRETRVGAPTQNHNLRRIS